MNKQELLLQLIGLLFSDESREVETDIKSNDDTQLGQSLIGKGVIVRCRDAGVHYGELVGYSGRVVELKNSRRMWRWFSKKENTLSGVARHGINPEKSKIQGFLKQIILQDACEIIPFENAAAESSIINSVEYNEQ